MSEKLAPGLRALPLLAEAHKGVAENCDNYVLCIHDWSMANFGKHQSKTRNS
jgi:hypothetical protein